MELLNNKSIEYIWAKICEHEGEGFYTIRNIMYKYVVLINNDKRRRVYKDKIKDALSIVNPTPAKLQEAGIWGNSYVYGIITDSRMV